MAPSPVLIELTLVEAHANPYRRSGGTMMIRRSGGTTSRRLSAGTTIRHAVLIAARPSW